MFSIAAWVIRMNGVAPRRSVANSLECATRQKSVVRMIAVRAQAGVFASARGVLLLQCNDCTTLKPASVYSRCSDAGAQFGREFRLSYRD